jgi:hypothetical protein
MNCQDARELFSALLDEHIGLTEQVPLEAHLRECEACQLELEALRLSDRPRPPAWSPNLDFARRALEAFRADDVMERLRQRVFPDDRGIHRARPRSDTFRKTLDVWWPANWIATSRRSVHARRKFLWRPRLEVDLVRKTLEAISRLDIANRRRRLMSSLRPVVRRLPQRIAVARKALEVARRALETIPPLAVATWNRRPFLRVRAQHLRLTAAVLLVTLSAAGLFRYRSELGGAVSHWVSSAQPSADAPAPTQIASKEPPTRPEIPQVSPPDILVPAPPAPAPSPPPQAAEKPAPERQAGMAPPAERMRRSSEPREPAKVRRAPAPSPAVRDMRANRPAKLEASTSRPVEPPREEKAGNVVDAAMPPASDTRPSLDVIGKLRVKSRSGAERDVAALVAKTGGTTVSRQRGEKITVIKAVVPNPSYGKFANGLTRIGSWQIEAGRSRLPDPVRVTVRLAE